MVKGRITRLALVRGNQPKTMTEELQRVRLAEALGWTFVTEYSGTPPMLTERLNRSLPDFLASSDACTALIDFLEKRGYACVMVAQHGKRCCTFTTTGRPDFKSVCDTFPKAICRSFLMVLGLWEK